MTEEYHKCGPRKDRRPLGNPFHEDMLNQEAKVEEDGITYITREVRTQAQLAQKRAKNEREAQARVKYHPNDAAEIFGIGS